MTKIHQQQHIELEIKGGEITVPHPSYSSLPQPQNTINES